MVRCKPITAGGILPPQDERLSEDEAHKNEGKAKDGEKPILFQVLHCNYA